MFGGNRSRQKSRPGSSQNLFDQDIELQDAERFHSSSGERSPSSIALENANEYADRQARDFVIDDEEDDDIIYSGPRDGDARENVGLTNRSGSPNKSQNGIFGGNVMRRFTTKSGKRQCWVIFFVCFIVWAVFLANYAMDNKLSNSDAPTRKSSPPTGHSSNPAKYGGSQKMTLDDERLGKFYVFSEDINLVKNSQLPDEGYYLQRMGAEFTLRKVADSKFSKRILKNQDFKYNGAKYSVSDIVLGPLLETALVVANHESQWRHSGIAHYFLYDIAKNVYTALLEVELEDGTVYVPKLSFAEFSPKGNYITYVFENNVYLCDLNDNMETLQLTDDGSNTIYNGKPDWVYEEEVLGSDRALWWAPDESSFTFLRLDDSDVPVFFLDPYANTGSTDGYPEAGKVRYPTPGTANPIASLVNFSIKNSTMNAIPREGSELGDDFIVYYCKWISPTSMIIKESDRTSSVMNVRVFDSTTVTSQIIRKVDAVKEYNGWINVKTEIEIVPPTEGHKDYGYIDIVVNEGYDHLGYFSSVYASDPQMLTQGNWQVLDSQFKYSPEQDVVYYLSGGDYGIDSLLHSVSLNGSVSTQITPSNDDGRAYFSVEFSQDSKYAMINYQGPDVPTQKLVSLSDFDYETYLAMHSLSTTSSTTTNLKDYALPTKEFYTYNLGKNSKGNSLDLNVMEVKPPFFNETEKYPLLVSVYGGPGSQKVSSAYGYGFEEVFAASLSAIVLYIDPRGTGGKGWEFQSEARDKIGYWEPRDLTASVRGLIQEKGYIDGDRTAIWGWSYGGFTTLKTLEYDGGDVFKYGMAVAPVTNWKLYDSIYTERYMDMPEDNKEGYDEYSVIKDYDRFKNVQRFLVMHGTADDNVHFGNTLGLLDGFDLHGIENYDLHVFPHSNHNIAYHNANTIVYDKLFNWLKTAFRV
ncbi:unnamed protein product [Kuraishia capsulata CBS 1993]|uniref:Dipeptidyl aminopeptidase A n=1 Tax=Kuraishia capsulata CBS 1993 TaxID=1382522 RepID=W6MRV9_9ASCO|nr:uncharacterized protein KUCA_T00000521001 [Kuraishia capsulata CBS 1993]CDK24555.1 unnamed protein product [Kuraishia capsulata CBS 1993]